MPIVHAVVACEIKLFQNYFRGSRIFSNIIGVNLLLMLVGSNRGARPEGPQPDARRAKIKAEGRGGGGIFGEG